MGPEAFRYTNSPVEESFSFNPYVPCRDASVNSAEVAYSSCELRGYCDNHSGLLPLFRAYGTDFKVSLSEFVTSIIIRSEMMYSGRDTLRRTIRKHFYELERKKADGEICISAYSINAVKFALSRQQKEGLLSEGARQKVIELLESKLTSDLVVFDRDKLEAALNTLELAGSDFDKSINAILRHAAAPAGCQPFTEDRFGRYLGFVDLRIPASQAYGGEAPSGPVLAMGLLAPPKQLRHDNSCTLVTGSHGSIFGLPNFEATFYSMHSLVLGGGYCAQACIVMALGMLSDRGAVLAGTFDITVDATKQDNSAANPPPCLSSTKPKPSDQFQVRALKVTEVNRVLSRDVGALGTSCDSRTFLLAERPLHNGQRQFDLRKCKRLIQAYVGARYPILAFVNSSVLYAEEKTPGVPHCVVIVGMREWQRTSDAPLRHVSGVIVHDPGYMPYLSVDLNRLLEAAVKYDAASNAHGVATLTFVGEGRVKRHAYACLRWLENHTDAASKYLLGMYASDYKVELLEFRDIPMSPDWARGNKAATDLKRKLQVTMGWYHGLLWCITGYYVSSGGKTVAEAAWLFSAEDESPPIMVKLPALTLHETEAAGRSQSS